MMFDVELAPQEEPCNARFDSQLMMTRGFEATFKPSSTLIAVSTLSKIIQDRVNSVEGADYFQSAVYDNTKFWIIDDGSYVTFLLPEEY